MKISAKKTVICALLSCAGLISFIIEGLFPPLFIPGARLGISNLFILLAVIITGYGSGYAVLIIKVVLGSVFAGNPSAILYSFPAGAVALTLEIFLINNGKRFSIVCASVVGGIINLTMQNLLFCVFTNSFEYLIYLPYLAVIGTVSGGIIGILTWLVIKYLPYTLNVNNISEEKNEHH